MLACVGARSVVWVGLLLVVAATTKRHVHMKYNTHETMEDSGDSWTQLFSGTTKNQPNVVGACAMSTKAGDVFVVGGASPDGTLQRAFTKFDFAKNDWAVLDSFPTAVFLGSSVGVPAKRPASSDTTAAYGTTLCVFGGQTDATNLTNTISCFNTSTGGGWVVLSPSANSSLPRGRRSHATALVPAPQAPDSGLLGAGYRMYMFGGQVMEGTGYADSGELWTFDFATATWARVVSFYKPVARFGHGMAALPNGEILVFWGNTTTTGLLQDSWIFGTNGKWSQLPSPSPYPSPTPRAFPVVGVLNGTVVSFGGTSNNAVLGDLQVLDPGRMVWHTVNSSSAPLGRWGAAVSAHSEDLFMMGGTISLPRAVLGSLAKADVGTQLWQLHVSDVCGLYSSCDKCTAMASQCGWCMTTSTCIYATADGNPPASCPRGFFTDTCPSCPATTCSECSSGDNCVWCEDSRKCAAGDDQGPFVSPCSHFHFDKSDCSECTKHASCQTCLADKQCGWCFANKTCSEGDGSGSFYHSGCSASASWWFDQKCPQCSDFSTCADCASQTHCGFCLAKGTCVEGSTSGSFDRSDCTRGYHFTSPCPDCSSDPAQASSCRRCTNHTSQGEKCGWCGRTSGSMANAFCGAGDAAGPFIGKCLGQWYADHSSCARCAQNYDCSVCVLDPDCAWCGLSGGYCVSLNQSSLDCPASHQTTTVDSCADDPPSWDPNGWNARGDYTEVEVVMGVIAGVAVAGLVGAALWWRRQSKKRLLPDVVVLAQERERLREERDREREGYLYRRESDARSSFLSSE